MADPDDANNTPLNKNLLKAIQTITSFDPTESPSANRKSLEDKLLQLAATLQMFQFILTLKNKMHHITRSFLKKIWSNLFWRHNSLVVRNCLNIKYWSSLSHINVCSATYLEEFWYPCIDV